MKLAGEDFLQAVERASKIWLPARRIVKEAVEKRYEVQFVTNVHINVFILLILNSRSIQVGKLLNWFKLYHGKSICLNWKRK